MIPVASGDLGQHQLGPLQQRLGVVHRFGAGLVKALDHCLGGMDVNAVIAFL